MDDDLMRLKGVIETGNPPSDAAARQMGGEPPTLSPTRSNPIDETRALVPLEKAAAPSPEVPETYPTGR